MGLGFKKKRVQEIEKKRVQGVKDSRIQEIMGKI